MKVKALAYYPVEMPLKDPNWVFALGSATAARGWMVHATGEDGTVGYGYCPAIPHMGSSFEKLPKELERFAPLVIGPDSFAIEKVLKDLAFSLRYASQAKGAIECALYDLNARSLGIPLYNLLGGKVRDKIPVLRIVSIKTPGEMAKDAGKLADAGYRYLKIKVHGEVAEDVARIKAIRKRVGGKVHLTIDANQSYTPKDAILAINRMAEFDIELAEQPVPVSDLKGLELVTRSVPITIEADEGAGSIDEIVALASNRIVDAVSLKVPKLGGLRNAIAAARICEALDIRYRLGAHVGTRLLAAHALHLAAALPGVTYACEVGEFVRMNDDPFEGLEVVDGDIKVPDRPGCGVTLRQRKKLPAAAAARAPARLRSKG
jgi:L-alanine-DL-glutamate epimerase-like enolase superfamily enzyme